MKNKAFTSIGSLPLTDFNVEITLFTVDENAKLFWMTKPAPDSSIKPDCCIVAISPIYPSKATADEREIIDERVITIYNTFRIMVQQDVISIVLAPDQATVGKPDEHDIPQPPTVPASLFGDQIIGQYFKSTPLRYSVARNLEHDTLLTLDITTSSEPQNITCKNFKLNWTQECPKNLFGPYPAELYPLFTLYPYSKLEIGIPLGRGNGNLDLFYSPVTSPATIMAEELGINNSIGVGFSSLGQFRAKQIPAHVAHAMKTAMEVLVEQTTLPCGAYTHSVVCNTDPEYTVHNFEFINQGYAIINSLQSQLTRDGWDSGVTNIPEDDQGMRIQVTLPKKNNPIDIMNSAIKSHYNLWNKITQGLVKIAK